jgi:hypothetical protein
MKKAQRQLLTAVAVALLITCSGCMKVSMEIGAAPDGSSTGRVVAGVDASLAQGGETVGGPFSGLTNSGSNWKSREYREGNWLMTEAVGSAAPGQALFPEGDGETPKTTVTTSARRLSTRYTLSLIVPPPDKEMMSGPTEDMDAQTQALVKSMLSSFEISFSLKGPGRVVSTTGTVVGPGKAQWKLDFDDLGKGKMPNFAVTTELANWTNIGRLADQLASSGRLYDCAPALASALARGLLPNPPANTAAAQKLGAEDYGRLLEIIDKLDAPGRPAVTEAMIKKLALNGDDTTAEAIAKAHARVMKLDVRGLSDSAITETLGGKLK